MHTSHVSHIRKSHTPHVLIPAVLLFTALLLTSCASTPIGKLKQLGRVLDSPAGDAIFSSLESIQEVSEEITPENEYYIGRSVAAAITGQWSLYMAAPKTTAYLNAICGAITMNSDMPFLYRNYCVAILDTDEINAMATPGGHIFISRGLIQSVTSEDALAAVIAHEIAHIQLKHSISAIKTNRITGAVAQVAKAGIMAGFVMANDKHSQNGFGLDDEQMEILLEAAGSLSDITRELTETLVNSGFSKSQEYEADEKALYLMADAGYDPNAMIEMLGMIPTGGKHGWSATHPSPEKRIQEVNDALEEMEDELELPVISAKAQRARNARFEENRLH